MWNDLPNWIIAAATIVYAVVTFVMYKEIKNQVKAAHRQAEIAERSADAAKKSADTLIEIERSWVMVFVGDRLVPEGFKLNPNQIAVLWIPYQIFNKGKTAARITKTAATSIQIQNVTDLPDEPDYANCKIGIGNQTILMPDMSIRIDNIGISAQDLPNILNGRVAFAIFGFVDYIDVFDRSHQTRFCYLYHAQGGFNPNASGMYVAGPPEYNKQT